MLFGDRTYRCYHGLVLLPQLACLVGLGLM